MNVVRILTKGQHQTAGFRSSASNEHITIFLFKAWSISAYYRVKDLTSIIDLFARVSIADTWVFVSLMLLFVFLKSPLVLFMSCCSLS